MEKMYNTGSRLLAFVVSLWLASAASAQVITGKVTSTEKGETLPGVNVVVKGTSIGAVTNGNGEYSLKTAVTKGTLVYSFIGYLSKEVLIDNRSVIDLVMEPDDKALNEVVVVGYGTQKRANVTGAVAQISNRDIEERPINRIENALAGQLPGVNVRTTTGEPGADLQIRVRGTGSINAANDPLYVVDGIPVDNLRGINPADVASIDVLKDASAAAIYGSRGSNGVVLVTTKKGASGKARINFTARSGIQQLEKKVPVLSPEDWIDFRLEGINLAWVARGVSMKKDYKASDPIDFRLRELGITNARQNTGLVPDPRWFNGGRDSLAYIDWQDEYYRTAPIQDYQLSVTGSTGDISYNISGGYLNQDGIARYTNYKRATLRANFEAKVAKRFKLGLTLAPSLQWTDGGRVDGKGNGSVNILSIAPVGEKDAGINLGTKPYGLYGWSGTIVSPIAYMRETMNRTNSNRLLSSMYLHADLVKGLQLQLTGAIDNTGELNQQYYPTSIDRSWATNPDGALSRSRRTTSSTYRYLFQSILNYTASFREAHNLNAIVGYSMEQTGQDGTWQEATKFANDWSYVFDSQTAGTSRSYVPAPVRTGLVSYFGRAQYDYKGKYLLSASFRADGSSRFGTGNKFGLFPAVSGGWRISDEGFMKSINWVQDLKLRASWGVSGNNRIGDYRQFALLGAYNYSLNGTSASGYAPGNIANQDLGWETTSSYDLGFDVGLFNSRVIVVADYYKRVTTDLLMQAPVSSQTGFVNSWQNVGEVSNTGFEFQLMTRNLVNKFKWGSTFNFSYNTNKVVQLGFDNTPILGGFDGLTQITQVGYPLGVFKMYKAIGVYKDQTDVDNSPKMAKTIPGDVKYEDVNKDGKIDDQDRTIVGTPQPKFDFGFINNFTYGRFDLSIVTNAQVGGYTYAILGRSLDKPGMGYNYNIMDRWKNRWRSPESPGDGQTPSMNSTTASLYDTRWLYSSDYLRIRNVTLGYNLPKSTYYSNARLYISVENLVKFDSYYGGYSPEASTDNGGDFGAYPIARTYTFGVNLSF